MKRTVWWTMLCVLALGWMTVACYEQSGSAPEETAPATTAVEPEPLPDPGPEQAKQVEDFVRGWVAERAGEGDGYNIPARAGHDLSATLAAFHTVHQKDADTYYVCVDFQDGDNTYDVDFLIDQTEEGLALGDHYLHKVNGEAVE